jgi:hypothetical protein
MVSFEKMHGDEDRNADGKKPGGLCCHYRIIETESRFAETNH